MEINQLRQQLMHEGLHREALHTDPYQMFADWFALAIDAGLAEPNAMSLATVDSEGQPWQRIVLLKTFDENGFVFFTNYTSRKAGQMALNNKVSLLFPWIALGRQVKVTGEAARVSSAESLNYFLTRPRGSQIGAWASPQSQVITNRAMLDNMVEQMKRRFHDGDIPLPDFWGGYRVVVRTLEFWQARDNRLHDRFLYRWQGQGQGWTIERLAP